MVKTADGLPIRASRKTKAESVIQRLAVYLDPVLVAEAVIEIGLEPCVTIAPDGEQFEFDLTDLQTVSLAAALAALAEFRGIAL